MSTDEPSPRQADVAAPPPRRAAKRVITLPITPVWPGRSYRRGANWNGEGVNFALLLEHAAKVELCIFDVAGHRELPRIEFREWTDFVWHA